MRLLNSPPIDDFKFCPSGQEELATTVPTLTMLTLSVLITKRLTVFLSKLIRLFNSIKLNTISPLSVGAFNYLLDNSLMVKKGFVKYTSA